MNFLIRSSLKSLNRRLVIGSVLSSVLVGCGLYPPLELSPLYQPSSAVRFDAVRTVDLTPEMTRSSVEAQVGGTVVSWHPEDGYAVIGLMRTGDLSSLGVNDDPNKDAYAAPELGTATAYGIASWSGGWTSNSGGWTSKGGGWKTFGGGWTPWGNPQPNSSPGENAQIWSKIRLTQAITLAPRAGDGIKVAIIDTGLDLSHPAFAGNLVGASDRWDWVDGDATPQDVAGGEAYGHGTAVAGIVLQVAPKVKLMPLRVLRPSGQGDTASVVAAIDFAVQHGAKIINLSLGTTKDKTLEKVIDSATKSGVFVVASSGNSGDQNVTYPASQMTKSGNWGHLTLGVGSSGLSDRKSRFSTYADKTLEMTAVGENVSSPAPGGKIAAWNGTSMAAPMVSGALALALGQRSFSKLADVGSTLSGSADSLSYTDPVYGSALGNGRLNLERFLTQVLDPKFK